MAKKFLIVPIIVIFLFSCTKNVMVKKGSILLNQTYKKGESTKYKIKNNITNTMIIQDMTQDQKFMMSFEIFNEIEKVIGDTVIIKTTINNAEGTMRVQGAVKFLPDMDKINGKSVKISFLKNGKILNVEGIKDLQSQNIGDNIRQFVRLLYAFIPNKQLNVGDSWEDEDQEDGQVSHTVYYLAELQQDREGKDIAIISLKSDISVDKIVDQNNMKVNVKINGKTKGKIYYHLEEGYVSVAKIHAALEGKSKIEGSPMGDMEIPTYINEDIEIKKIK